MRWFVQYPESAQKGGPRAYGDWNREHIAFVVWTGDRFELREKVARAQWPCDPVAPGDRACGGFGFRARSVRDGRSIRANGSVQPLSRSLEVMREPG